MGESAKVQLAYYLQHSRRADMHPARPRADIVGRTEAIAGITQAQAGEAEARDGWNVPGTGIGGVDPSGEIDL
jgi:hypothetical protein